MLTGIEFFIELAFSSLLEKKVQFHFIHALFDFLENPQNQSYLAIAKFYKQSYSLLDNEIEKVTKEAENLQKEHKNYKQLFFTAISSVLCDYKYTFTDKNNILVQSNLLFSIVKNADSKCLENLIDYLNEKHLNVVLHCPQICHSSYIYSTIVHELLRDKKDRLALKCAINSENKTILFLKDARGDTTIDLATENNCDFCLDYLVKIKEIGQTVGIVKN